MKNANKVENAIYIWYAAYDEDMNFSEFMKRAKYKPKKIIPSILMGQEVCFDLAISDHAQIVQKGEKYGQMAAYAMVKLYTVKKSQLIEIAKHKNGLGGDQSG